MSTEKENRISYICARSLKPFHKLLRNVDVVAGGGIYPKLRDFTATAVHSRQPHIIGKRASGRRDEHDLYVSYEKGGGLNTNAHIRFYFV